MRSLDLPEFGKYSFQRRRGAHYKYEIRDLHGHISLKTDPYGAFFERPPRMPAIVEQLQVQLER